ncbi:MAG: dicarboxylate/amino acid:cation symporter [Tissierellia bacterium]|nr:dicarboxylate/amino acid:cation symporter [Tissierellia bacterium]
MDNKKMKTSGLSLPIKILIALVVGAIVGFVVGEKIVVIKPLGDIFLRLLRMTIVPLVFCSIITGISGISDLARLRKVGVTFIKFWLLSSALAAISGIVMASILKPGVGIVLPNTGEIANADINMVDTLVGWIPENAFNALSSGNMIQVIIFAVFVGISIVLIIDTNAGQTMYKFFEAANELMQKMVSIVLKVAPIGVFALMANVTGTVGGIALLGIGKMLITQYLAYVLVIISYGFLLKFILGLNPIQHFVNVFPAMVLAFTTQSSSGTIPVTMEVTKNRSGVPEDIVNVITAPAATINMQACSAEMPIYAIFAAQIYGLQYEPLQFIQIIILGIVMAAGVGGVPGGGIMMSAVMLEIMGLPLDIVPWIAGVYLLIDMPNTMLNVTGDTVGMVYTAEKLGELDKDIYNSSKR